jgi:hypothetical protein
LLGKPKSWTYVSGDAIDESFAVRKAAPNEKRGAHLEFFYGRYGTYDPEAIRNIRLLELRATNYDKLYAERCASVLLACGLTLVVAWSVVHLV